MMKFKRGVALLITLLFIMAITVSIGIGFKYVNDATKELSKEKFLYQSKIIIEDILNILKRSDELNNAFKDNSVNGLYVFLREYEHIPFSSADVDVSIQIKSARAKFNINNLSDTNGSVNIIKSDALREYFSRYGVNNFYVDILLDNMMGIQKDNTYNSDIFIKKPYLFRDYIASRKHLKQINDFYKELYHDDYLKNIKFEQLFYFSEKRDTAIDVNYASAELWEMILGATKERALQLVAGSGNYTDLQSLNLSDEEVDALNRFKISYFEPYLYIIVEIMRNNEKAKVSFEYNVEAKKGFDFTYEI
jgi:hypothetical protein